MREIGFYDKRTSAEYELIRLRKNTIIGQKRILMAGGYDDDEEEDVGNNGR